MSTIVRTRYQEVDEGTEMAFNPSLDHKTLGFTSLWHAVADCICLEVIEVTIEADMMKAEVDIANMSNSLSLTQLVLILHAPPLKLCINK